MFALIKNSKVVKYPYTVTDLRRDTPNVSFPDNPSDAVLLDFGVHRVYFSTFPDATTSQVVEEALPVFDQTAQRWTQVWNVRNLSTNEIQQRNDVKADEVRAERNTKLASSDWTQLQDAPLGLEQKAAWSVYRQALRDISTQADFPWDVQWPTKP